MSMQLQVLIAVALGAFCFGCGYLTAFIVTRNRWRDEMIERHIARYDWQTGSAAKHTEACKGGCSKHRPDRHQR